MFKIASVSGAPPQTPMGSLRRSPDPLVVRGFLPSAIAASRLRRLHFPRSFLNLLGLRPKSPLHNLSPLARCEINKIQKCTPFKNKMFKIASISGAPPQTPLGELTTLL